MNSAQLTVLLTAVRLPARLSVEEAGFLLGFLKHEVTVLMREGLLKPLARPAANGHKYFFAADILELAEDRVWVEKATRAVQKCWADKNENEIEEAIIHECKL